MLPTPRVPRPSRSFRRAGTPNAKAFSSEEYFALYWKEIGIIGACVFGPDLLEDFMAALIDAINVKRKTLFEFENTPFCCLEAEVNTPTARGGQTLVRLKMRNLLTERGL